MTDETHKRIGDYEIIRELGHGGMGQVYLVRNVISDRVEAMKVLLPDLAQQGDLAGRFMREIKVLASLDHPNIALLRTAFTAENQLVMIMEYVEGDTLAHMLEPGPFSTGDALNYSGQVLGALSYAHSKGIIHRDIKPANMMLTPQGAVKLMDFGIARSSTDLGMTVTGTTLGSLDYMSPEQVKSEPTDSRSDLYSVGVSLYEMVTGQRMFSATSSYSVMEAHIKEVPRAPIEVQPTLPRALSDIIMMAVAKEPGQRFQTAEALRNALSQISGTAVAAAAGAAQPQPMFVTPPPAQARPSTPRQATVLTPPPAASGHVQPAAPARAGRHVGWIVVAAIVVLVAAFGGTQVYRSHKQNPAPETAVEAGSGNAGTPSAPAPSTPAPNSSAQQNQAPTVPNAAPDATSNANQAPTLANSMAKPHNSKTSDESANLQPPAAPDQPSAEELAAQKKLVDDMEKESDQLDSRAAAVESSLDALEQQMHQSGLGLRGDMVASRSNLRIDMTKAKQALDSMDTDRARRYLDQANHELEKLEAFLHR